MRYADDGAEKEHTMVNKKKYDVFQTLNKKKQVHLMGLHSK